MADAHGMTREERLAAKLRENLRRRKAQARALDQDDPAPDSGASADAPDSGGATGSPGPDSPPPLSKPDPSR